MEFDRVTHNVSVDAVPAADVPPQSHNHHHHQQQQQQSRGSYYFTSTLTLRSVVTQDTGAYICSAASSHGFIETRTFLHVTRSGEQTLSTRLEAE